MSGFAKLIPAFSAKIRITQGTHIGTGKAGGLTHVGVLQGGSFRSEPDYPIHVDAVFESGSDYIVADPDGKHVRLEVTSHLKVAGSGSGDGGEYIRFVYTGIITMGGGAEKIFSGQPDAKSSDFGEIFTQCSFQTGSPNLAELEHKVYVGSGRFVLEEGQPMCVEYKISEVAL